jgi:hypothetical protein
MDGDTIMYVVWAVLLFAIIISALVAYWARRRRTKGLLLAELFDGYFRGDVRPDQVGQRAQQIASRHFRASAEFYALVTAAFQRAVSDRLAHEPHSEESERKLLRLLAALKTEFGLTDRYQIEAWRAGRE